MYDAINSIDFCALTTVRRIAAMLDIEPASLLEGALLPRGWHFFLLGGATQRSVLRADGFPGFGVPMPDFGLPRLMFVARRVTYVGDLMVGATIHRRSSVIDVKRKQSADGEMAIVTIQHTLAAAVDVPPTVSEEQTYILLGLQKTRGAPSPSTASEIAEHTRRVTPDETLLFQFSALGFNSHKIHIDRAYARDVEGLPDLVVNGGLAMLLMTEFLRVNLGVSPARIAVKHIAPLYCGRPLTLAAKRADAGWLLHVHDDIGTRAIDAEVLVS